MATENLMEKQIVLLFEEGPDEEGKYTKKRYTYSNIISNSTPEQLLTAGQALQSLYAGTPLIIMSVHTNHLF